jgi:drug/metabolite transporter (DMT)-like permease
VLSGILILGERPTPMEYAAFGLVIASLLTVALPARK